MTDAPFEVDEGESTVVDPHASVRAAAEAFVEMLSRSSAHGTNAVDREPSAPHLPLNL